LKDLVLGQVKINESLNKKLVANDKTLKNINIKIETLSFALENQLSFNKMIETQLAQIAAAIPAAEIGRIPRQPKAPVENVSMITTRWGNPSRKLSHTNRAGTPTQRTNVWGGQTTLRKGDLGVPMISCSIYGCQYDEALCDLGASVNIMPKVIFEQLQHPTLSPTRMCLQLADSTIRYPEGIVENLLVRVKNFFVLADFVVLDMEGDLGVQLILGDPS
jgi:hypothetical protein